MTGGGAGLSLTPFAIATANTLKKQKIFNYRYHWRRALPFNIAEGSLPCPRPTQGKVHTLSSNQISDSQNINAEISILFKSIFIREYVAIVVRQNTLQQRI